MSDNLIEVAEAFKVIKKAMEDDNPLAGMGRRDGKSVGRAIMLTSQLTGAFFASVLNCFVM